MQTTLKSFALAATMFTASHASAQTAPVKVGLMLPATGTFANLGTMIENAVQGYDAAQMLHAGLKAAGGDVAKQDKVIAGMAAALIDSPRGKFRMSPAHNPVQDVYLRQVKGNNNEFKGIAMKALADPAKGCRM